MTGSRFSIMRYGGSGSSKHVLSDGTKNICLSATTFACFKIDEKSIMSIACVCEWGRSTFVTKFGEREKVPFFQRSLVPKFIGSGPLQTNWQCSSPSVWRNFCRAQCEDEERAKLEKWSCGAILCSCFLKKVKSCNSLRTPWFEFGGLIMSGWAKKTFGEWW